MEKVKDPVSYFLKIFKQFDDLIMQIMSIILSRVSGNMLWLLSRSNYPKQFIPLVNRNTMLQETILRLKNLDYVADPIIVFNISRRFVVTEKCHQIKVDRPTILFDPEGRNTAPAIVVAALNSLSKLGWKRKATFKKLVSRMAKYDLEKDSFGGKKFL